MGLLTRIFGNREDDATGTGEGSEETIETDQALEPGDAVPSETPGAPADALDTAPNRQPVPVGSAPRHRHAGANVSDTGAGAAFKRGTTRAAVVEAADGERAHTAATSASADAEGEDSEEIDVSDQLEELDDLDGTDDLDASGDIILEDDEDEETSTSVSFGPARGVSDASATARVAAPEERVSDVSPFSKTRDDGSDEERDPTGPSAHSLGSATRETPKRDLERMRMPSEMKTPKQTLVEAGTEFKGSLKSSCPVVVNGTIDGDIDAPTLSIALTGAILGTVKAKTLRSQGTLSGHVEAEEVFLSGAVRSKTVIKTRRLEVKIGSSDRGQLEVTFGNCDLELSDRFNEPESSTNSLSIGESESESESDPFTSSGWDSADVATGSAIPTAAASSSPSSGRSTSKSSRRAEASGDDTKKTLR